MSSTKRTNALKVALFKKKKKKNDVPFGTWKTLGVSKVWAEFL
jgi:hypothetical protein